MKFEKALDLVLRYSLHVHKIKELTKKIGDNLELCKGINGDRHQDSSQSDFDDKGRDKRLHLWNWYQPICYDADEDRVRYMRISEEHSMQCKHCYAAHLAVQERKEHRKKLGHVKAVMTKSLKENK